MNIYAQTTSDRATKGQGGNKYICIKLTVQNGSKQDYPIGEITLDYMDDHKDHGATQNEWVLKWLGFTAQDAEIIAQGHVEPPKTKGKQQKGEVCSVTGCETVRKIDGTERYYNGHIVCDKHAHDIDA